MINQQLCDAQASEKIGVSSELVTLSIRVIEGQHKDKHTRVYSMRLTDMQGKRHKV